MTPAPAGPPGRQPVRRAWTLAPARLFGPPALRLALVLLAGCAALLPRGLRAGGLAPSPTGYYLSLGDSLSVGIQPDAAGVEAETNDGYPDQLAAVLAARGTPLILVKLGCPGEQTTTMIGGGICAYRLGSQLAEAAAFLRAHRGEVALVTINLGANDVLRPPGADQSQGLCIEGSTIDADCVARGLAAIRANLPGILSTLRGAAGPDVPFYGMNVYDPWLAAALRGPDGEAEARLSLQILGQLNSLLATDFQDAGIPVADVAARFSSLDSETTVTIPGVGPAPLNVARICAWTWMCAPPPAGPNIHANAAGYAQIAAAFLDVIGSSIPQAGKR